MPKHLTEQQIEAAYRLARERYAALGVDTEQALHRLGAVALSLHCWQGDDVGGFEDPARGLSGGILATGHYPGKARTPAELRADLDQAYRLIPGQHRLNLHAIYLEADTPVARNAIEPRHFAAWVDWARANQHGLDFNPTCFSHPLADSGFTLAHADIAVRDFWVEHCAACREIGAYFGRALGTPAVTNVWIPDGFKDTPADRGGFAHPLPHEPRRAAEVQTVISCLSGPCPALAQSHSGAELHGTDESWPSCAGR